MLIAKCSARKTRLLFIVIHCVEMSTSITVTSYDRGPAGRKQMRDSTAKILCDGAP